MVTGCLEYLINLNTIIWKWILENLGNFVNSVRNSDISGVSCTMPHKIDILPLLDQLSPEASIIGAVNTIVNSGGVLRGYNTDYLGVLLPIFEKLKQTESQLDFDTMFLSEKNIAVLGAGGAARAAGYGLVSKGAKVTVINRTQSKVEALVRDFSVSSQTLSEEMDLNNFDIIINTTSVGMGDLVDRSLLRSDQINCTQIVFESIYSPIETQLIKNAKQAGASVIYGIEMLLHQAFAQFKLYTGLTAPKQLLTRYVYDHLNLDSSMLDPILCGVVVGSTVASFIETWWPYEMNLILELRVDSIQNLELEDVDNIHIHIQKTCYSNVQN